MKQKIVFFGSGAYTIPTVKKLQDKGLMLVVTTEKDGELVRFLKKEQIPFIISRLKNKDDISRIQNLKPNIGVLASYGAILPKKVIELFLLGILNIHPSLLPKYKGSSPVQYTILNGDLLTGVTIIKLDDQVDHGPIVAQEKVELSGRETFPELTKLLFLQGADMVEKVVQKLTKEPTIQAIPQRINQEEFTKKITKEDGKIILSEPLPQDSLDRKIRAFYPWPGVYLTASLGNQTKIIKLLPKNMVQVEGKRPMSYKDFINGYGKDALKILESLGISL